MLSDGTIRQLVEAREIGISPQPADAQFQPVSIDLTLGTSFVRVDGDSPLRIIDTSTVIRPGEFMLAATQEFVRMPRHIAAEVKGKSTIARRGLLVECAGLVDPGFEGTITLELKNLTHRPLPLTAGMAICQIAFYLTDAAVVRPYGAAGLGSHYQGQVRATPAAEA